MRGRKEGVERWSREKESGALRDFFFVTIVMPAVVVRQRKPYRRKDGTTLYFEGAV